MRKLLSILFSVISITALGQFPSNPTQSNANTKNVFLGGMDITKGAVIGYFVDTTAANSASYTKGVPYITITTLGNILWQRNAAANQWVQISGGGGNSGACGAQIGGLVSWDSLLVFQVSSSSNYCIDGTAYSSAGGSIVLDASDPSLPRFDAIVFNTSGLVDKVTGTPSTDPQIPQIDPSTQYFLTYVLVNAGATGPSGVTSTVIYDENVAPDWAGSSTGLSVDFGYTANPSNIYHLSTSTNVGSFSSGDIINYTGTGYPLTSVNMLKFFIKLKSVLSSASNITVTLLAGGIPYTYSLTLGAAQGFSKTNTSSFQNISIPLAGIPIISDPTTIDGIRFTTTGTGGTGFYLDYITLQGGIPNGGGSGGNYVEDVYQNAAKDTLYKVKNGIATPFAVIPSADTTAVKSPLYVINGAKDTIAIKYGDSLFFNYTIRNDSLVMYSVGGDSNVVSLGNLSGYLKLTGTDPMKPMTGVVKWNNGTVDNIEIDQKDGDESGEVRVFANDRTIYNALNPTQFFNVNPAGNSILTFSPNGVLVNANSDGFGLSGEQDFSPNILSDGSTNKAFSQVQYVQNVADSIRSEKVSGLVAGSGITIDSTNKQYPVISSSGGGGSVDTLFYNVRDFGAIGDSATDDRAAVLATIAAANAAGGGVVFFPAGRYRISDSIKITHSVRLMGVTKAGAIGVDFDWSGSTTAQNNIAPVQYTSVIYSGLNKSVFVLDTAANGTHPLMQVEKLAFVGDTTGVSTYGSFITVRGNIQGVTINDCSFYGGFRQVWLQAAMYMSIYGNHFSSPANSCLYLDNDQRPDTGDGYVSGNVFSSGKFVTTTAVGIYWNGGGGRRITNNKFDATTTTKNNQFIYGIDGGNPRAITCCMMISGNSIENFQVSGIRINFVNDFFGLQINNNQISGYANTGAGIDLTNAKQSQITDNAVGNGSTGPAILLTTSSNIIISGLTVNAGYTSGYSKGASTNVVATDVSISSATTSFDKTFSGTTSVLNNTNASAGLSITNASNGTSARTRITLTNNAGTSAYLTMNGGGAGGGVANKTFFEADKDFVIGTDASTASGGTSKFQIYTNGYNSASAPQFTLDANGRVGIGTTVNSPTSYLHLRAGSATASTSPFKLTAGTVLTTPESGVMETNSTNNLFYTDGTAIRGAVQVNKNSGASATTGIATLVAGTVTVNTTSALTASNIQLTVKTAGGVQGFLSYTIVNATSFTINSTSAAETSTVGWQILN